MEAMKKAARILLNGGWQWRSTLEEELDLCDAARRNLQDYRTQNSMWRRLHSALGGRSFQDELEDEIDLPAEEEVQYEVEDEIVLPDEHTEEKGEEERAKLDEDNPKDEESLPLDWNEYKNVIDGLNCDLAELERITKTMCGGGRKLENYEGILLGQTRYQEEIAGLRGEISSLNNNIEERDSVISSLNNVIEESDSVISSLNNVIEESDSVISSLNNVIEGKEFDISEAMTKEEMDSQHQRIVEDLAEALRKQVEERRFLKTKRLKAVDIKICTIHSDIVKELLTSLRADIKSLGLNPKKSPHERPSGNPCAPPEKS
ncbi:myosin-4-like [Palaemon carinicauda]|uniref:myosin-4-like n=1 Tax=Palaemon carinicauda TaxID=392227 RepID=UPI0035B5E9AC